MPWWTAEFCRDSKCSILYPLALRWASCSIDRERGECKSTCFRVYYWNFERRRYFRVVVVEKRFTLPFIISHHLPQAFSEEKVHFPVLYQCRSWSHDFNCSYHVGLCKEPEDHKVTNCFTSFYFEKFRLQTRYLESTIPLLNVLSCTCIPWFYSSIGTSDFKMWFNPQTHQPALVSSPSRLYRIFFGRTTNLYISNHIAGAWWNYNRDWVVASESCTSLWSIEFEGWRWMMESEGLPIVTSLLAGV